MDVLGIAYHDFSPEHRAQFGFGVAELKAPR